MTVHITFTCDVVGDRAPTYCTAAITIPTWEQEGHWGARVADIGHAFDAARRHGWTDEFVPFDDPILRCPTHTRERRAGA